MVSLGTRWVTPPSSAGIDVVVALIGIGGRGRQHPSHRLVQAVLPDRLEQVVKRADVEGRYRFVVMGRHEHDGGTVREVREHTGEFNAGQPGHVDVEEDRVDVSAVEFAQCRRGVTGSKYRADIAVPLEKIGQFVQCGRLVVDRQHRQRLAHDAPNPNTPPPARTPERNLGTRIATFVPAPIAVSTTRP